MNPLRHGQGKGGRGRGGSAAFDGRFGPAAAPGPGFVAADPGHGSAAAALGGGSAAGAPRAVPTATATPGARPANTPGAIPTAAYPGAAYPTLASLQAGSFAWWANSSSLGTSEGIYPPGGYTNLLRSNGSTEDFHFVGNTAGTSTMSPTAPSLKRTIPVERNAQDEETINLDDDENNEDERTERRLNWTKPEDVRLASAWVRLSKDPIDGTDRKAYQYWADVTKEYNKDTEVCRRRNRNQIKIRWDRVAVTKEYNKDTDRKDVECAFGILQALFCILRRPARLYDQGDLENIMLACIILHNMIIEDEKDEQVSFDLNEKGSTSTVREATINHGKNPAMEDVLNRNTALNDRNAYRQLQSDLVDHIWQKFRHTYRQNN